MKKILIPIGALLVSGLTFAQTQPPLSSTENYIQARTYLEPVTTSSPTAKKIETVQYFDGLGRPKQVINVKASPQGKDVVSHIEYDSYGRQVMDYLPVPQQGTQNGTIYPYPLYNATQPSLYGSEKIYAEKIFDKSPLDRILQQKQVGTAWNEKPVNFGYAANISQDAVKKYMTATTWSNAATSSALSQSIQYSSGQLYKNTVTDEDGNISIEFKNGEGQVVLVRKIISDTDKADTYYVYNEYNQLAFVIPPKAAVEPDANSVLSELCYQYKYDGKGRLVEKKLPGKGWEYMVYDLQDRLVMSQDANMGSSKEWLFTKYDQFGRAAYTGLYTSSQTYGSAGRAAEQTAVNSKGSNNVGRTATVGFTGSGMEVYYDNNSSSSYPSSITKLLSVIYYDTYPLGTPSYSSQFTNLPQLTDTVSSEVSTKGLLLASYAKNIENDSWTKNYSWYDNKGRVIGTHSVNYLGGYTKTDSWLDFAGVPQRTNTYHLKKQGDVAVSISEGFIYDHQNRLLQHYHKVDDKPEVLLTDNSYNELSQVRNKTVGNNLQSIDYTYNIRGWLTHINRDQMSVPDLGGKLFAYRIRYNEKEGITNANPTLFPGKDVLPKYNGNIAEVDWRSVENIGNNPSLTPKRYGYAYDKLNRLTAGYYQNPLNAYSGENTESLSYDLNGNIISLYRTSVMQGTVATKIDDLTYTYNGNKAIRIKDDSRNRTGYEGTAGYPIAYDANGNMKDMIDKQIAGFGYNYLGLMNGLSIDKGTIRTEITTLYGSGGNKLKKENYYTAEGFASTTWSKEVTDYLDGFQYLTVTQSDNGGGSSEMFAAASAETKHAYEMEAFTKPVPGDPTLTPVSIKHPELKFFPTSEGFYDYRNDQYIYQYEDHLGNTRISFARNSAGALEIVDANDYYPFGMNHLKTGGAYFGPGSYKNYKYNGKEIQETGMYDYGARMYMADIGRWGAMDPLAEKHPDLNPMMYAANNPIMMIDPDGKDWVITQSYDKKTNTTHYQITFTGAVLNSSSNKKIDMKRFATTVQSQTKAIFNNIDKNPNYTVTTSVNIKSINDKKDLKNTDTLLEIKDSDSKEFNVYKDGKSNVVGIARNGKEVSINENYVDDIMDGTNSKTLPHEIGHTGGLQHPAMSTNDSIFGLSETFGTPKSNFMIQGAIAKPTGFTVKQINRMYRLYKAGKLNSKNINPVNIK